jgi:hypothetical protein
MKSEDSSVWWKLVLAVLVAGWLALLGTSSAVQVRGEIVHVVPTPPTSVNSFRPFAGDEPYSYLSCTYFTGTGLIETRPRDQSYCRRIISLDQPTR